MSGYPEPRRVELRPLDTKRLTVLELARALAVAEVTQREVGPLLHAVVNRDGTPAELERGTTLLYAIAWQLERRVAPATTWAEAQTWAVAMAEDLEDLEAGAMLEAEARAGVEAALATGLPPAVAGELSMAQIGAYADVRAEAAKRRPRGYRRHR